MTFFELQDGTRIRCTAIGHGPVVVLVHGWKQSHRLFDQVTHRLASSHRVIAFDQRGTGESDKPDCTYDFALLGSDLIEILDYHEAVDATVVGWSMGCTVVLSAMQYEPRRVGRVVLVNGPLRLTRTNGFPYALSEAQLRTYIDDLEKNWPATERKFLADSLLKQNAAITPLLEYVAWQTPLSVALKLVRNQNQVDHRETIKSLDVPVLAAYSQHDPYWPIELARWIAVEASSGYQHTFTQSAHCAPLEEPQEFTDVIQSFVSREA